MKIGQFLLKIALVPLTRIPKFMWRIPKITDIFILIPLAKASLPPDIPQTKSIPIGYVQPSSPKSIFNGVYCHNSLASDPKTVSRASAVRFAIGETGRRSP
jgi:hypothetical protein